VTLVTILSERAPVVCIHPYAIDTQDNNVIQDSYNNSLYFSITNDEIFSGVKRYQTIFCFSRTDFLFFSFRISRKKMTQHDLRSYGAFRLFDLSKKNDKYIIGFISTSLDRNDVQRVMNIYDAKQIIETYQLWKSQLVFTIAERLDKTALPVPILPTSVTSQIMCDEASGRRSSLDSNSNEIHIFF
jgi:hypothetical protein